MQAGTRVHCAQGRQGVEGVDSLDAGRDRGRAQRVRGGRAIYFEVKSCQHGTFSLSSIEPEQWAEMDRVRELGAGAWLVVFWRPPTAKGKRLIGNRAHAWCVIPWATVALAKHEGHTSLGAEVLARCAVFVDWIDVIASVESSLKTRA